MYIKEVREKMPNGRADLDSQINLVFFKAEKLIEAMIPDLKDKYNEEKELILELCPWDDDQYRLCLWVGSDEGTDYEGRGFGSHSVLKCPIFYVAPTLSKIIRRIDEDRDRLYFLRSAFGELPF